jgi:hypothetical protein
MISESSPPYEERAADTTACASSWIRARCSGPWKLSA